MNKRKPIYYLSGILVVLVAAYFIYRNLSGVNINIEGRKHELLIPTGSTYEDVYSQIKSKFGIKNPRLFNWIANRKGYPDNIKSGRYVIDKDLTYNELINILRSGKQSPVNLTFNNIRSLNQLAGKIGAKLEADSTDIISFLTDESNFFADGFKKEEIIGVFIPNTYQFLWNTDAKGFYERMLREYKRFWNEERLAKAKEKGLTPNEVSILASIVDDEVVKKDEKPRIAGVYLNRIKRGIPLQACPTIKFALNDFTITRVLTKYLQVDSPYNTYKHKGFPPGPIGCPSIEGIDAVLNAENHDYIYFAAKADFSGYHNFSRTLSEHNRYAAQYQRELDRRKIFK